MNVNETFDISEMAEGEGWSDPTPLLRNADNDILLSPLVLRTREPDLETEHG